MAKRSRSRTSYTKVAADSASKRGRPLSDDQLSAILAQRVLGWRVGPDRFLLGDRRWLARWRFQPLKRVEDANRLLKAANAEDLQIGGGGISPFRVRVRLPGGRVGEACDSSQARAITCAVARAFGIPVEAHN